MGSPLMLKEERKLLILEELERDGRVVAAELSRQFGVSEDTIRRDLRELAEAGRMHRVHGGALPRSPAATTFSDRLHQAREAKTAIAQAAVRLFHDGQVVILDGGTTTLLVAESLPSTLRATLITNSPPLAGALSGLAQSDVIVIGGRLLHYALTTAGVAAVDALRGIRADLCILGVCSVDPDHGMSVPTSEEAEVKRAMISSADQVVALVSPEKLDTSASFVVGPLSLLTHMITDAGVPEERLAPYRAEGIQVIRA